MALINKLASLFVDVTVNTRRAEFNLNSIHKSTATVSTKFLGMAGAVAAGTAALLKLSDMFTQLIQRSSEFEDKFIAIEKVVGVSADQTDRFRDSLINVSKTLRGISLDQILEAAKVGGRMGIPKEDIQEFAKMAGIAAKAMDEISAEAAAEGIGKLLNLSERSTKEFASLASVVNTVAQEFLITEQEILDIAQRAQGFSQAIGVSVEETIALGTALKELGVRSEVAGSIIIKLFESISRDPMEVARIFNFTGASLDRFLKNIDINPLEALFQIFDSFKEQGPQQIIESLEELGVAEVRYTSGIVSLGQSTEKTKEILQKVNEEAEKGSSIFEEASKTAQSLSSSFIELQKSFDALLLSFDIGPINDVTLALAELVDLISLGISISGQSGGLLDFFKARSGPIGPIIDELAKNRKKRLDRELKAAEEKAKKDKEEEQKIREKKEKQEQGIRAVSNQEERRRRQFVDPFEKIIDMKEKAERKQKEKEREQKEKEKQLKAKQREIVGQTKDFLRNTRIQTPSFRSLDQVWQDRQISSIEKSIEKEIDKKLLKIFDENRMFFKDANDFFDKIDRKFNIGLGQ